MQTGNLKILDSNDPRIWDLNLGNWIKKAFISLCIVIIALFLLKYIQLFHYGLIINQTLSHSHLILSPLSKAEMRPNHNRESLTSVMLSLLKKLLIYLCLKFKSVFVWIVFTVQIIKYKAKKLNIYIYIQKNTQITSFGNKWKNLQ